MATKRTSRTKAKGDTFIQRSRAMSSEQKAIFHEIAGAGRGRVVRSFFDLSDADTNAIVDLIDRGVQDAIAKAR